MRESSGTDGPWRTCRTRSHAKPSRPTPASSPCATRSTQGRRGWGELAEFFTPDAVYIDPAWGRIEGREAIREFFVKSMAGLTGHGWSTPENWTMAEGHRLVSQWDQILGHKPDGTRLARARALDPLLRRQRPVLLQPRHAQHDAHRPDDAGDGLEAAGGLQHAAARPEPRCLASRRLGPPRAPIRELTAAVLHGAGSESFACCAAIARRPFTKCATSSPASACSLARSRRRNQSLS